MNKFSEVELKLEADNIVDDDLLQWAMARHPVRYFSGGCPDVYYSNKGATVRHRWSTGAGELTVKRRKSNTSTTDREEIDLKFDASCDLLDVQTFLAATGWKRVLTIFKNSVHVFFFELPGGGELSLSLYSVEKLNEKTQKRAGLTRWLELEVEKGSKYDLVQCKKILNSWLDDLKKAFRLGKPVNLSLFEIYTNKRYEMVTK